MKNKYNIIVSCVMAILVLSLPVSSASESNNSLPDITHGLKDFFAALPRINSSDIDRITEVITVIKHNPINNTTASQITEVAKTAQTIAMNNTTVTQITKVIEVIKNNPPNNATIDNITKVINVIQKINTTTLDQITRVVRSIDNTQNRSD